MKQHHTIVPAGPHRAPANTPSTPNIGQLRRRCPAPAGCYMWIMLATIFDVESDDSAPPSRLGRTPPSRQVRRLQPHDTGWLRRPPRPSVGGRDVGRAEPETGQSPSLATPTRRAQHASRGPYKNTVGSALPRRRIFSARFIRVYHSQNSFSASRSVQEIPASLRNCCSSGVAVCFH